MLILRDAKVTSRSCCGEKMSIATTCLYFWDFNWFHYSGSNSTILSFLSFIIQHVDPVIISQKVIQGVYPGVTTSELDE